MIFPNWIDQIKLYVGSGHGGSGAIHFRKERFVPKGGPDGGDGGRGGHIILRGNRQLSTLLHLQSQKYLIAENGKPGGSGGCTGAMGKDIVLEVPLGTVAKDADTNQVLVEITQEGEQLLLFEGGKGGRGNVHFKSARHQTPRYAQPGQPGAQGWVTLELTLLADAGLVGFPNAGKSTLLSVLSSAKPKIANYPFTTLMPNLGVVHYRGEHAFVMADIPGIIGGAVTGRGLGIRFLRHIERNAILLFIIAANTPEISRAYTTLVQELRAYSPKLLDKPRLLVISKADLVDNEDKKKLVDLLPDHIESIFISSATGQGLTTLKDKIWKLLHPAY